MKLTSYHIKSLSYLFFFFFLLVFLPTVTYENVCRKQRTASRIKFFNIVEHGVLLLFICSLLSLHYFGPFLRVGKTHPAAMSQAEIVSLWALAGAGSPCGSPDFDGRVLTVREWRRDQNTR